MTFAQRLGDSLVRYAAATIDLSERATELALENSLP
jgi:hypothetical protein